MQSWCSRAGRYRARTGGADVAHGIHALARRDYNFVIPNS